METRPRAQDFRQSRPVRAQRASFFQRDADPAKKPAHHRGVSLDAPLGQKAIAEVLKRPVRLVGSSGFQKRAVRHQRRRTMAAVADRLARPLPPIAFKPLDRHQLADLVSSRRRATAHPAPLDRIDHTVAQILRIRLRHPCWPPPSQQVESEQNRFENPPPIQANVRPL